MTWRRFILGPDQMMDRLNNALMLGPYPASGLALGGRTLIFTTPGQTVTLPGAADALVRMSAVVAALEGVPGLHATQRPCSPAPASYPPGPWSYLVLWRDGGAALSKDGTANAMLGLSASNATAIKAPLSKDAVKSVSRTAVLEYECIIGGTDEDFDNPSADGTSQQPGGGGGAGAVTAP